MAVAGAAAAKKGWCVALLAAALAAALLICHRAAALRTALPFGGRKFAGAFLSPRRPVPPIGGRRVAPSASSASSSSSSSTSDPAPSDVKYRTSGPVLSPSDPGDDVCFDSNGAAHPVVLPPSSSDSGDGPSSRWRCFYYGNPGHWAPRSGVETADGEGGGDGPRGFLPTGWIGLAESGDGVSWTKVLGGEAGGSVLAPTGDPDDWDGVHVGVGDVVKIPNGDGDEELHMYYLGGSGEEVRPGLPGLRMRIGRARSSDGGRTWERMGMVLDYDEAEGLFASWPRLMIPENSSEPWRMVYHSFDGRKWTAYGAVSLDGGDTWTREGEILGPGGEGSWDESGVGTRAVLRRPDGSWDMVYEGVDGGGTHRLGLARLVDGGDGKYGWVKAEGPDFSEPGGPILWPGVDPLGPWTSRVVGTPYLAGMEDGSVRLYFVSRSEDTRHSIGLVVSGTGDLGPASWREMSP